MDRHHQQRAGDPSGAAPERPRTHLRGKTRGADWLVVTIAIAAIATGLLLGQALMLAGGLILAFTAVHRLQRQPTPARRGERTRKT